MNGIIIYNSLRYYLLHRPNNIRNNVQISEFIRGESESEKDRESYEENL